SPATLPIPSRLSVLTRRLRTRSVSSILDGAIEENFGRNEMLRRSVLGLAAAGAIATVLPFATPAMAEYPERPLTIIVPWGAGGGTDATARIIGSVLEKELGQPVNVVNRTGGSGVVGHSAIAEADPDGYTLGIATVEIGMMHWQGLTELTWEDYTALALMNEDAAGVQVAADSEYDTLEALLAAIEAGEPG